jgi:hypothetical protein
VALSARLYRWSSKAAFGRPSADPTATPCVFRFLMPRGEARQVVATLEIEHVWRNERGVLRWEEGPYPTRAEPLRKGGNAFLRGDVAIRYDDAWWMGREQTDLRILLAREPDEVVVSASWARAGVAGLGGHHETDGELLAVELLLRDS